MNDFSTREAAKVLVITIDNPATLNDFRSNSYRDSLYQTVSDWSEKRFAVDLTKVDFLSSSGVAILVGLKRRVEPEGGKLVIFGVQDNIKDLLRITRLLQFFTLADNETQALEKANS